MPRTRAGRDRAEAPALPAHLRLTPQRRALLATIGRRRRAFTAVELHDEARKAYPRLGLATTYRTLDLLRQAGTVRPIHGEPGTYTRCRPDHHHHHLVCLSCGGVEETELCAAPPASELKRRYGFAVESHELEIYGTCARCA